MNKISIISQIVVGALLVFVSACAETTAHYDFSHRHFADSTCMRFAGHGVVFSKESTSSVVICRSGSDRYVGEIKSNGLGTNHTLTFEALEVDFKDSSESSLYGRMDRNPLSNQSDTLSISLSHRNHSLSIVGGGIKLNLNEVHSAIVDYKDALANSYIENKFLNSFNYEILDDEKNIFVVDTYTKSVNCVADLHVSGDDDIERIEQNEIIYIGDRFLNSNSEFETEKLLSFPNDPMYNKQWNFKLIGVERAWETGLSGKGVIVAVLDTGVSDGDGLYKRVPDLKQTKFVNGYNFVDNSGDAYDGSGHGTHVAGTIAQSTNNGYGVAGIAYNSSIMPIKVLSDKGFGSVSDIVKGIRFAVDNGANVINLSLGGGSYSKIFEDAIKYAYDNEVFVACAAGNNSSSTIEYPAAYDGCHAVSSVGPSGELASYSSYGRGPNGGELFISAPGGDMSLFGKEGGVWQDTIDRNDPTRHGFFPFQGTSMATPHVAGGAALVIESLGEDYTVDEVAEILAESSIKKNDSMRYGKGILSVDSLDKRSTVPAGVLMYLLLSILAFSIIGLLSVFKLDGDSDYD